MTHTNTDETANESGLLRSRSELRFPHPTERPNAVAVVFDGRCRLCTQQIRWLHRLDFRHRLSFISLHDPLVAQWWPHLTYDMLMEQIYVLPPKKVKLSTSNDDVGVQMAQRDAFYPGVLGARYVLWQLPLLWPIACLMSVPFTLPIWRAAYRWVARNRYRFGKLGSECDPDGTCHLHFGPSQKKE